MYQKLKKLRRELGYTMEDMSILIGISKTYYCQIEHKTRRLNYVLAHRIASVLNTTPDVLFLEETKQEFRRDENERK